MAARLGTWRRRLERIARITALAGGFALSLSGLFTVVAVCLSAVGHPVLGDTEIVEFAAGVAVMCFLPYCQMRYGHVTITTFTAWTPRSVQWLLDVLAAVIFVAVIGVLSWQLLMGGLDAYARGHISMFLQLPRWWGFALCAIPAALWFAGAAFIVCERLALGPSGVPEITSG